MKMVVRVSMDFNVVLANVVTSARARAEERAAEYVNGPSDDVEFHGVTASRVVTVL